MQWITSTYLKQWADQRDCQDTLPLLIRRLIRATVDKIDSIQFPAGDAVYTKGWDGILNSGVATDYIPQGVSVWEISARADIQNKANQDYDKRTSETDFSKQEKTTYIFVTPRIWVDKDEWASEKKSNDSWEDVKVYDARNIESWIELAPSVGSWIAKELGRSPRQDIISAIDYWDEWKNNTNPPLISDLVTAGRQNQIEDLNKWITSQPSPYFLKAFSNDEAIAFILAVADKLNNTLKDYFFSRSVVVKSLEAFRETMINRSSLIIIKGFEGEVPTGSAIERGHHVFVPLSFDNTSQNDAKTLSRLGLDEFVSALCKMGFSDHEANALSKETGRSITVLRRRIGIEKKQPIWAKGEAISVLIPILMFGRWDENYDKDKDAISTFYGDSYVKYVEQLNRWILAPDSPILKIGDSWRLTSPYDAFFSLAPFISNQKLETYKEIAIGILSVYNPVFDIEPEKRYMASVYGKRPEYSGWIREGIAQFLILIAVYGQDTLTNSLSNPQSWVDEIVKGLLERVDWKRWCSLSEILPLIAEASPQVFIDAINRSLLATDKPIMGMFAETDSPLFSSSPHIYLLWALEGIAWNPEIIGQVTLVLGKLAELDPYPDSNLMSRPLNSLIDIYRYWYPQTFANIEQRISALDSLLKNEPEIGWKLLVELMPKHPDTASNTHRPRWRKVSDEFDKRSTLRDGIKHITYVVDRLLNNIDSDGKKWAEVIKNYSELPASDKIKIINSILEDVNNISNNKQLLRNEIRTLLSRHRSFKEQEWALPDEILRKFDSIYKKLEPPDLIYRYSWLFDSDYPDIPEGLDFKGPNIKSKRIEELRIETMNMIYKEHGIYRIVKLAENVELPWFVGVITGKVEINDTEKEIVISFLKHDRENKLNYFSSGFVNENYTMNGVKWVQGISNIAISNKWSDKMTINFFLALPEKLGIWEELEKHNQKIIKLYWEQCQARFYFNKEYDLEFGIRKLIEVNRYYAALSIIAHCQKELDLELMYNVLEGSISSECAKIDSGRVHEYDIQEMLQQLDKRNHDSSKIALLEWQFLPLLSRSYSKRSPLYLHKEMAENPEFFSSIIKWTIKPKDGFDESEDKNLTQEQIINRARNGRDLLKSWKTIPGMQKDGSIDKKYLLKWINKSQQLCKDIHREKYCNICIGELLSSIVKVEDQVEISEVLCEIVETLEKEDIDHGIFLGILNQRGTTSRGAFEGGKQEYVLRDKFKEKSKQIRLKYPRIAAILHDLSQYYENDAKREDEEAKRTEMEY